MRKEDFKGFERHEYNPIIRPKTENLLIDLLNQYQPKKVLEIGTFIGYSTSVILENSSAFVTSLEKDEKNVQDSCANLESLGFKNRYNVIHIDAFDFLQNDNNRYDMIFLDGPKGQYYKYFPFLKKLLNKGGVLIADDILFYGLVNSNEKIAHKHRTIVNNLRKFINLVKSDKDFNSFFYDFEDGVCVAVLISK